MKHILFSLLFAVCAICTAQTNHMKFKGIPMEGTPEEYAKKLMDKGYEDLGLTNGVITLQGEFATEPDCLIFVQGSGTENKTIHCVSVTFLPQDSWNKVHTRYTMLKDLLTRKYGKPECVERFSGGDPQMESLRFLALLNDECEYECNYECENGRIVLSMTKLDSSSAVVSLVYFDKQGIIDNNQKILDDL